eukprot:scaffold4064_cov145-Cylindrotheca_fusiformis.AAC.3
MVKGQNTTLGSSGYKKQRKEDSVMTDFRPNGPDASAYSAPPRFQTHLLKSFENRVWQEIEFRFLAYQVAKFIFENALGATATVPFAEEEFLSISFRVLANCKERRGGLNVLSNLCIAFGDTDSVSQHRRQLLHIWKRRENDSVGIELREFAQTRTGYANDEIKIKTMNEVFAQLRQKNKSKFVSPTKDKDLWWTIIKAQIYRAFLDLPATCVSKRDESSGTLKEQLIAITSTAVHGLKNKKRKSSNPPSTSPFQNQRNNNRDDPELEDLSIFPLSPTKRKKTSTDDHRHLSGDDNSKDGSKDVTRSRTPPDSEEEEEGLVDTVEEEDEVGQLEGAVSLLHLLDNSRTRYHSSCNSTIRNNDEHIPIVNSPAGK